MSTFKSPVGPQPKAVYARRRLTVGLGFLAVLVVVVLIIIRPGSGGDASSPGSGEGGSQHDASRTATQNTSIPTSSAVADGTPCDPANIVVEAITDREGYEADVLPLLSLSLKNTGSSACTINAGTSKQVYSITSGSDVYWVSTDCQTDPVDTQIVLESGALKVSHAITWDRTRSSTSTCSAAVRTPVMGGGASYYLTTVVDGVKAQKPKQFVLY